MIPWWSEGTRSSCARKFQHMWTCGSWPLWTESFSIQSECFKNELSPLGHTRLIHQEQEAATSSHFWLNLYFCWWRKEHGMFRKPGRWKAAFHFQISSMHEADSFWKGLKSSAFKTAKQLDRERNGVCQLLCLSVHVLPMHFEWKLKAFASHHEGQGARESIYRYRLSQKLESWKRRRQLVEKKYSCAFS